MSCSPVFPVLLPCSQCFFYLRICLAILVQLVTCREKDGAAPSPCQDRYALWLSEPSVFVRDDEPKHLQGLHVACVWRSDDTIADSLLNVEVYQHGVFQEPHRGTFPARTSTSWKRFRKELKVFVKIRKRTNDWGHVDKKQPLGVFSEDGLRLGSPHEVLECKLIFIFEGGQWVWPPVRVGFLRIVTGTRLRLETLSVQPIIYRVRAFLLDEECEEIVALGQVKMLNSSVSFEDTATTAKELRTSSQASVSSSDSSSLQAIDNRVANLTRVSVYHNEDVQILRYERTQYYSAHLDNWDPATDHWNESWLERVEYGHKNRLLTVLWYLNNVTEGGQTCFPRVEGLSQPEDMYSCERGLKIQPERGGVLLWYSLHPNGNANPNGLHAACPVVNGQKWSANYWVWNKPRRRGRMPDDGMDDDDEDEADDALLGDRNHAFALFENKDPDKSVELFWRDDRAEVFMGNIEPRGRRSMHTSPRDVFVVREPANHGGHILQSFVMSESREQTHKIRAHTSSSPEL